MTQIELFEGRTEQNRDAINEWLKQHPGVTNIHLTHVPMHDMYKCYGPPQICNQYVLTTLYYTPAPPVIIPCTLDKNGNIVPRTKRNCFSLSLEDIW